MGIGDWGLGPIPNPHGQRMIIYFEILKNKLIFLKQIINKIN